MNQINYHFKNMKSFYQSLKLDYVFDSIYEGHTLANIYVDCVDEPQLSIVHEGHSFYFGGQSQNESAYDDVIDYFKELLTEKQRNELGMIKVYYTSDLWKEKLLKELSQYECYQPERSLLVHQPIDKEVKINNQIQIQEIDHRLMDSNFKNKEALRDEIIGMWGSIEHFLKDGFGVCAIEANNILGWCTAEYKSHNACGIGIETVEEFQNQGIGTAMVNALIQKYEKLNLTVYWDSWKRNEPSIKVAKNNHFDLISDYQILIAIFEK